MSRIHDALKRAAEERNSRSSAGAPSGSFDVEGELHRHEEIRDPVQATVWQGIPQAENRCALRYEELIKRCSRPVWRPDWRTDLFNDKDHKENGSESFRTLRSRLHQIAGTRRLKRVLITSSLPAEGKTFVATNLALSIARQPDRRVLLIDADLRNSQLHNVLGAPYSPGLTDYLRGELDEYSVIQSAAEDKLFLIPGGSTAANPSELLLSERMKGLMDLVTPLFDVVILDSPPSILVHDANLLADICDGTILVVRAGVTNLEVASKAKAEFENRNLLGVVLNGVGPDATYGKYYGGYYGNSKE